MPANKRDILDRLADFDHYGGTATERYTMRLDAFMEITRLRKELIEAKAARGKLHRALNERISEPV